MVVTEVELAINLSFRNYERIDSNKDSISMLKFSNLIMTDVHGLNDKPRYDTVYS